MPSETKKQAGFMRLSAHKEGRKLLRASGKKPAPVKVAKEFVAADVAKAKRKKWKK